MMLITSMRLFLLKRKEASLAIQFTFPTRVRFDCVGVRMGFSTVSEHFQCINSTFEKMNELDKIFILSTYKIHQLTGWEGIQRNELHVNWLIANRRNHKYWNWFIYCKSCDLSSIVHLSCLQKCYMLQRGIKWCREIFCGVFWNGQFQIKILAKMFLILRICITSAIFHPFSELPNTYNSWLSKKLARWYSAHASKWLFCSGKNGVFKHLWASSMHQVNICEEYSDKIFILSFMKIDFLLWEKHLNSHELVH